MIFLILFGIIAIIVIALNFYDSSNLNKIKTYLEVNNCQNIIYSQGKYKGICKNEIIQIPNSFSIDLENDKRVLEISSIKKIEKNELNIILNSNYKIEFKDKKNLEAFNKAIEEKYNK